MSGPVARQYHQQMVHFLRKTIAYTDNGSTLVVGRVPAGSLILQPMSGVAVTTVFNGNSSNVLDVGYSTDSGTNNLATSLALGTAAFVPIDETTGPMLCTSDTTISVLVTSTASASTGSGEVIIAYVPDTDG